MAFIVAVGWIKVVEDLKDFDEYEKVSRFFYVHIFTDTAVLKSLTSRKKCKKNIENEKDSTIRNFGGISGKLQQHS